MEWRLESGEFDFLEVEKDGTVYANFFSGGCLRRTQININQDKPLKVGPTTAILDFRERTILNRYKLKHK